MLDIFRQSGLIPYECDDDLDSKSQIHLDNERWNTAKECGFFDEGFRVSLNSVAYKEPYYAVMGDGLELDSGCVLSSGGCTFHLFLGSSENIELKKGILIDDYLEFLDKVEIRVGSLRNIRRISKKYTEKREKLLSELAKETGGKYAIDISGVDVLMPPGFAGVIVDKMNKKSFRNLPEMSVIGALTLGGFCCNKLRRGYNNVKMYFSSICIAPSASGKESFQDFIYKVAAKINVVDFGKVLKTLDRKIIPNIASSKDITQTLIEHDFEALWLCDEGHSLMKQLLSTDGHNTGLESDILKYTTKVGQINLPGLWVRQAESNAAEAINGIRKKLKAKDLEQDEKERLDEKLLIAQKTLYAYKNGMTNPKLHLCMTSTPKNFAQYINPQNIESGMLGRCAFAYVDDMSVGPIRDDICTDDSVYDYIANKLSERMTFTSDIKATPEAKVLFSKVRNWFDQQQYRCHEQLGAIYRRGYETVLRIASIIAHLEARHIQDVDVRWSYAFFEANIGRINSLYLANITKDGDKSLDLLIQYVIEEIKKKPEVSLSIVVQNVHRKSKIKSSYKIEEVKKIIEDLALKGERFTYTKNTKKLVLIQ